MLDYLTFKPDLGQDEAVSAYDELPLWSSMFGLLLLKHIDLRPEMNVLDVGCGTGFPALELAQRLGRASRVYAVDPWRIALKRAHQKRRIWQLDNVELIGSDATALPFAEARFDMVVSNLGINNFRDPERSLKECYRVMKDEGKVVLTTNLIGHMSELYVVFEATLESLGYSESIERLKEHIQTRATVESIESLFEKTGFRLSRAEHEVETMRFSDGSALLRHYFIKLGFLGAWKRVVDPEDREAAFRKLEENLNALARDRGDLCLTIPMAYLEGERTS